MSYAGLQNPALSSGTFLIDRYMEVRNRTLQLCSPLSAEDSAVQSMPDASPAKWHLAHTTWFFETFILSAFHPGYVPFDPAFCYLFNSYYNTVGERHPRPLRGILTRPSLAEVVSYRAHVDRRMQTYLSGVPQPSRALAQILETGLHHEQQHQELLLTDIKHLFSLSPLYPAYVGVTARDNILRRRQKAWVSFPEGLYMTGHDGEGFGFDNEFSRHEVKLVSFEIASVPTTNAEYLEFMKAGGYRRPELWLSEGWDRAREEGWESPLYWVKEGEAWNVFTLSGLQALDPGEPVCHVSYYEADAYARWAGARLPTEPECEAAARSVPVSGNMAEAGLFHPRPAEAGEPASLKQLYGDNWEWTQSAYLPYPGYRQPEGALGEYNAKFMCSQMVLRGGSCVTPRSHIRPSYRNFFPPRARWQFSGLRLARDGASH